MYETRGYPIDVAFRNRRVVERAQRRTHRFEALRNLFRRTPFGPSGARA